MARGGGGFWGLPVVGLEVFSRPSPRAGGRLWRLRADFGVCLFIGSLQRLINSPLLGDPRLSRPMGEGVLQISGKQCFFLS